MLGGLEERLFGRKQTATCVATCRKQNQYSYVIHVYDIVEAHYMHETFEIKETMPQAQLEIELETTIHSGCSQ